MKLTQIALLASLATLTSAQAFAQGTQVNPTPTGTAVTPAPTSTTQTQQQGTTQTDPNQQQQQTGGDGSSGVFGPSAGPGIFGPAGQNNAPATGVNNQLVSPSNNVQLGTQQNIPGSGAVRPGSRAVQQARPGQTTAPTATDIYGNPIPTESQAQNPLPRDLQPLTTPSPAQPAQPSSGTVTGR